MVKFNTRGLVAPVFTPFNDDFSLNLDEIPKYVKHLAKENINGILVNGTSGEAMSLSVAERKVLTEMWVREASALGIHVMVQVGGAPLPDVLELAKHAESIKAGSLLCLPELYFKPRSVDELVSYFEEVSKAAPNTPLLYYHFPANTNVTLYMPDFITEARKRVPTFRGIKFTSNDLEEGAEAVLAGEQDCAVFLGADTLLCPAFAMGFDSTIGTTLNMLPSYALAIEKAIQENDSVKASEIQKKLSAIVHILKREGTWVPIMKVAMELYTDIKVGPPRAPLRPLTPEQCTRIADELKSRKLL